MTFFLFIPDYIYIILLPDNKSKTKRRVYRNSSHHLLGGEILAHGVLNKNILQMIYLEDIHKMCPPSSNRYITRSSKINNMSINHALNSFMPLTS